MSVLFTDSCDGYSATTDVVARWSSGATSGTYARVSPEPTMGRFGAGALRTTWGTWNGHMVLLTKFITITEGAVTHMSMAINMPSTYSADEVLLGFGNTYFDPAGTITNGSTFDTTDYPTYLNLALSPSGQLKVRLGTTVLATSVEALPIGGWMWLEIAIKVDTQANGGKVHIRVDGEDFLIFNGNTYASGPKAVGAVSVWSIRGVNYLIDDVILHNDQGEAPTNFIGDVRIALLMPNADGDASDSTPSSGTRWDAVNELVPDGDSSYVQATTPGATDLYQFENFPVPPESIVAVAVTLAAKATGTTNRQVRVKAKAGGVEADSPSMTITPGTYRDIQFAFAANPATGLPWTAAELDAAQFGWEVVV